MPPKPALNRSRPNKWHGWQSVEQGGRRSLALPFGCDTRVSLKLCCSSKRGDNTCYSASSLLPQRASLTTAGCAACGTRKPQPSGADGYVTDPGPLPALPLPLPVGRDIAPGRAVHAAPGGRDHLPTHLARDLHLRPQGRQLAADPGTLTLGNHRKLLPSILANAYYYGITTYPTGKATPLPPAARCPSWKPARAPAAFPERTAP